MMSHLAPLCKGVGKNLKSIQLEINEKICFSFNFGELTL